MNIMDMKRHVLILFFHIHVNGIEKRNEIIIKTIGVLHCGLAICIKKYFKTKEELEIFKYFTMQKYKFQKFL